MLPSTLHPKILKLAQIAEVKGLKSCWLGGATGIGKTLLAREWMRGVKSAVLLQEDRFFLDAREGILPNWHGRGRGPALVVLDEVGNPRNWIDRNSDREKAQAAHTNWNLLIEYLYLCHHDGETMVVVTSNHKDAREMGEKCRLEDKYIRRLSEITGERVPLVN